MAIGTLLGAKFDLDGKFNHLTAKAGGENSNGETSGNGFAKGLSTAILLFCVGALSILGPVQSALYGDSTLLFTNATLDFVTSIVFACAYGIGIMWAALVLFIWQGSIYVFSLFMGKYMSDAFFCELSIVGGLLILASGFEYTENQRFKNNGYAPCYICRSYFMAVYTFYKNYFLILKYVVCSM